MDQDQQRVYDEAIAAECTPEEATLLATGWTLVDSSAFRACRWIECDEPGECCPDDKSGHLQIVFKRAVKTPDVPGARWNYSRIPRGTFDAMIETRPPDSIGKYFAREIKGKVPSFKIETKAPKSEEAGGGGN